MSKRKSGGPLGLSAPPPDLSTDNDRDNEDDGEGEGTGLLAGSKRNDTLKKKVADATLARTKTSDSASNGAGSAGKEKDKKDKPETPLPKMKVALVGMVLFADTFSQLLIFPFLPFMVHDFFPHLNKHELGYYAGYLGGMFYIGSFSFNIFWGRQADRYGRRPIMIMGMVGTIISTLLFGISQSFYWALIVRFLWGSMNGNIGIAKTYLSEVCDDSNSGRAFSLMGMLVGLGRIFGPAIGGFLAQPAQKYPSVFGHSAVFTKYAYLLPCLFAAAFGSILLLGVLFYMEETLHSPLPIRLMFASQKSHDEAVKDREKELKLLHLKSHDAAEADDEKHHISHKTMDLLKQREVFLSCVLYGLLAMTALVSNEIFPLWVVAKKEFHGFDFGTSDIGTIHSLLGPTQIFYQFMIYPHLLKRYGVLKLFKICTVLFSISLVIFPFVEVTQQIGWSRFAVCTVMFLVLVFMVNVRNTCFTCVFVFVANSCISQVRGTVNGIGQSFAAAGRALGPTLFSSVFAWTMGNHLGWPFNFHFLWDFLAISSLVLCWIATHLPDTIVARKDALKAKGDSAVKASDAKAAAPSVPAKTNKVSPLPSSSSEVAVSIAPESSPSASPSASSSKLADEFPPLHHLKPNMYINLSVMPPVEPLPVPIELDAPAADQLDRGSSDDTITLSKVQIESSSPSTSAAAQSSKDDSLLSMDEESPSESEEVAAVRDESALNPLDNPAPSSSPAPLPSFSALLDQPPKLKAKIARSKKKKSKKGQGQNLPAVHEHGFDEDDE